MATEDFVKHLKRYLDDEEISSLISNIAEEDTISALLLDEDKLSKEELLKIYPSLKPHPQVNNAFLYDKSLPLGKSLLFEIGAFYLLEPCSLLVNYLLEPSQDDLVLDVASAPGGKTIHASFLMHNQGQILANEINGNRVNILSSNSEKYGRKNVTVISTSLDELAKRFPNTFDKVILDAPCSGSGMFKKEKKMEEDWTLNKVLSLSSLQKELILKAYATLKPGGTMAYSTCSFSYEEDEEVVEYLLNNSDAKLTPLKPIEGGYYKTGIGVHLFPNRYQGDGHYICKISKPGVKEENVFKGNALNKKFKALSQYQKYGDIFINDQNDVYLTNHILDIDKLHVLRNGIKLGNYSDKLGLVFDHNLSRLDLGILDKISLTKDETIKYIEGNTLSKDVDNGYYILTYLNIPFALTKVTNKILKNHYPKGLRKKIKE